ncbi:flagellar motor switch protein FliN [Aquisediminimonas sediminicola]|uniref:flagellar motor switch protein FliN n=1 Tax=Alteraquisediminimonas sediminicola TaxID=2676787 RepID=UPI001C8EAAEB|nr:flagellar motor switch protein FliN [Aquisediminimonas sediminicola]
MSDMTEIPNVADIVTAAPAPDHNLELLAGVSLRLSVEVGSASIRLSELLSLSEGSVVQLDREADDLLDIFANGTLIAKGEVIATNGRYGIRVVEVVSPDRRMVGMERRS